MPNDLVRQIREFYLERVAILMRHEEVAKQVEDYDVNNTYQYLISREETHLSWLQHALLDLGAEIPADPTRPTVSKAAKAPAGWQGFAAEDARTNAAFVEKWRDVVDTVTHARHRGMLKVVLGETMEHKRFFDQAAAGRTDLLGTHLAINERSGVVAGTRWME